MLIVNKKMVNNRNKVAVRNIIPKQFFIIHVNEQRYVKSF